MRLDRRPLLDTTVDADLFVGREAEVARLLRAVELSLNTVVTGCHGIGRSSLLRRLAFCLRQRQVETVQISAAGVDDAADLLRRLLRRLAGEEAVAVATLAGLDADGLVEHIGRTAGERSRRSVVLLDDLSVPAGRSLFGALRDELWRLELTWLSPATTRAPTPSCSRRWTPSSNSSCPRPARRRRGRGDGSSPARHEPSGRVLPGEQRRPSVASCIGRG